MKPPLRCAQAFERAEASPFQFETGRGLRDVEIIASRGPADGLDSTRCPGIDQEPLEIGAGLSKRVS